MSKNIPASVLSHYGERTTFFKHGLRIVREDEFELTLTSNSHDDTIDGVLYKANPGLDISSIVTTASFAVGNLELRTLHDEEVFTTLEIMSGVWRNAAFTIFRYNSQNLDESPTSDVYDVLLTGTLGELTIRLNDLVAELRDLRFYFQHPVGVISSETCRNRLGLNDGIHSFCNVDLEALRVSGSITDVTNQQTCRDLARAEVADYFGQGVLTWISGDNVGLSSHVYSHAANGTFVFMKALIGEIQVGDSYTVVPGCRKRLAEDCRDKFDSVLDFNGEPHRPKIDDLTQPVTVSV